VPPGPLHPGEDITDVALTERELTVAAATPGMAGVRDPAARLPTDTALDAARHAGHAVARGVCCTNMFLTALRNCYRAGDHPVRRSSGGPLGELRGNIVQDPWQQPTSPSFPAAGTMPPESAAAGRSRTKLWATGAAVVSAATGVVTAFAAFSGGSPSPGAVPPAASVTVTVQPSQSPAGATASSTQASGDSRPASPSPAAGTGAGSVRWSGKVVLGLEGIDLEKVPPRTGSGFGSRPAAARSGSSSMMVKGTVALWTSTEAPTPQGCKDLLATQSRAEVTVGEGDSVCLVNEHSPIAVLKVTATSYDQGTYGLIEGQLTTWNLRSGE